MVAVESSQLNPRRLRNLELEMVPNELELINRVVDIIIEIDPDIIAGWETQSASWGYLAGRGKQYGK
jgi:DNA polymerase zeta